MAIKKENTASTTDKQKALETAMAQIEKAYGKGSIMRLGENHGIAVEAVPTGSLGLDIALGIGGVPRAALSRSTDLSLQARRPWPYTFWLRPRSWAARPLSLMPSMPWIQTTPRPLV